MYKEYKNILEKIRVEAIKSFKNFCKLLDLDSDLFNHIYNIPIEYGYIEDANAHYIASENIITINIDCLDDIYYSSESERKYYILDVSVSLVHEMLHANRTIFIENGIDSLDYIYKTGNKVFKRPPKARKTQEELKEFNQRLNGHNVYDYMMKLNEMINNKPYIKEFNKYIPIKINIDNDNYRVIAYNLKTKTFYEFNQEFETKIDKDIDNFLYNIGIELNNKNYQKTNEIFPFKNQMFSIEDEDKEDEISFVVNDYYMPYNRKGKIVENIEIPSKLSEEEIKKLKENYEKSYDEQDSIIETRFKNSDGLEEIITQTLADIIIMTKNKDKLELDIMCDKIINSNSSDLEEKIGANFIKKMGIDMVKWFMTSVYASVYDDKLEKIFQEKYDKLLESFNNLYNSKYSDEFMGEFINKSNIDSINEILDEKTSKKK